MSLRRHCLRLATLFVALACFGISAAAEPVPKTSPPRTDLYGDPLPPGALVRFGTLRFRSGSMSGASLAISPDAKRIITVGQDGVIETWEIGSGRRLDRLGTSSSEPNVWGASLSPDGRSVAIGAEKQVRIVDLASGKHIDVEGLEPDPNQEFGAVPFSPDGKRMACCGVVRQSAGQREHGVNICAAATGKKIRTIALQSLPMTGLAFAPDGHRLITADEQAVQIWDVDTGTELHKFVVESPSSIGLLELSPDGRFLAVGRGGYGDAPVGRMQRIAIWDATTGKELRVLDGDPDMLLTLVFSPDGKRLAASGRRNIRVWDVQTGALQRTIPVRNYAFHLQFLPDSRTLFFTIVAQTLHSCDVVTGREPEQHSHQASVAQVVFSPDGKRVATAGAPRDKVSVWNAATGARVTELPGAGLGIAHLAFVAGGTRLVSGGPDCVQLWDIASAKELQRLPLGSGPPKPGARGNVVQDVRLGPDGKTVFVCSLALKPNTMGRATLIAAAWDVSTGKSTIYPPRETVSYFMANRPLIGPDGTFIAEATGIADFATGKPFHLLHAGRAFTQVAALSGDGNVLALAQKTRRIRGVGTEKYSLSLWETVIGGGMREISQPFEITALAFSPDGRILASGDAGGISFWKVATGEQLRRRSCPDAKVTALAFSPDGRLLASGLEDTTGLIWDIAAKTQTAASTLEPPAEKLSRLWAELASADAAKGQATVWALAAAPKQAVALVKERLHPMLPPRAREVAQLISKLDDRSFSVREAAAAALRSMGEAAFRRACGAGQASVDRCGAAAGADSVHIAGPGAGKHSDGAGHRSAGDCRLTRSTGSSQGAVRW